MKKILLLLPLFAMISCGEIQYDAEKRLVFQTKVLNANGEPLANSHIDITVLGENSSDLISKGKTDANGRITLIFPSPQSDVNINLWAYNDDESYMPKEIWHIKKDDFENYKFIYPDIYLLKNEETAPLNLVYNQVSSNTAVIKVGINGIYHQENEFYHFTPGNYYDTPEQILIKKNQAFQLKYTVLNFGTNVQTDYVVDLQIVNDALDYTINY